MERMDSESYLQRLTTRISAGLARVDPALRQRQTAYLLACQNADGGFSGREGDSDLYYTAFGLRGLAVLDELSLDVCDRATRFLRGCLTRQTTVVDFFSFLYACLVIQAAGGKDALEDSAPGWPERVAAALETFRVPDGGYNKTPGSVSSSTYHKRCPTFLGSFVSWPAGGGTTGALSRWPRCAAAAPIRQRRPLAYSSLRGVTELPFSMRRAKVWPGC
jgi:hypothetical protein